MSLLCGFFKKKLFVCIIVGLGTADAGLYHSKPKWKWTWLRLEAEWHNNGSGDGHPLDLVGQKLGAPTAGGTAVNERQSLFLIDYK